MNKCLSLVHLITVCLLPIGMAAAQSALPQARIVNLNVDPEQVLVLHLRPGYVRGGACSATGKEPVGQMRLFTPDADFIMKLNSLEQQLAQSREDNKQLRRRIATGDRRIEAEQSRNRQLEDA
jgi:hypothetical protein